MTDETGCVASAFVWIVVKDEHVYYAPNVFSPNGDGINDVFQIYVKGIREFHLQIHDRWGELVFRSDNPNAAWNGTLNGRELPNGVYVYDVYVIYQDGVVYKKKGSITLVR
jgi:gliding motility-associated-like protein